MSFGTNSTLDQLAARFQWPNMDGLLAAKAKGKPGKGTGKGAGKDKPADRPGMAPPFPPKGGKGKGGKGK